MRHSMKRYLERMSIDTTLPKIWVICQKRLNPRPKFYHEIITAHNNDKMLNYQSPCGGEVGRTVVSVVGGVG